MKRTSLEKKKQRLKSVMDKLLKFGEEAVDKVMKNYHLNNGQAKAILHAKANDGFTLVQG